MRVLLSLLVVAVCLGVASEAFQIGAGIRDVTGPIVEVPFMGYAMGTQKGNGLHLRLKARAFVFADDNFQNVVAYVSADLCMIFHGVKEKVVQLLQNQFGSIYNHNNVLLTGTHTHGGPGGFSSNTLYAITVQGFQQENFDVITSGLFSAIVDAHNVAKAGGAGAKAQINTGVLLDSNINRSPIGYENNPDVERAWYTGDTDTNMTVVRMFNAQGKDLAMVNWFAVHGTSMDNTNLLVSSDNKGVASLLFEKLMNGEHSVVGSGPYISAFAQTNSGDVSPRTKGAFCPDGTPCERVHSTCNGKNEGCNGIGPGKDMFDSTLIIAAQQVRAAAQIAGFNVSHVEQFLARRAPVALSPRSLPSEGVRIIKKRGLSGPIKKPAVAPLHLDEGFPSAEPVWLDGPVSGIHAFVDMENLVVTPQWTGLPNNVTTCLAAMGDSFAAGTTDGNGELSFIQADNTTTSNPFWNMLAHILSNPTKEQIACQAPKPILFNTGGINFPTPWTQAIQPLQILRVGQLFIVGTPSEFTTMAGRRLRASTAQALRAAGVPNPIVVIGAIANAYSGYCTTTEEYVTQRYEGASTIFGPHELAGYQQEFARLATALAKGEAVPPGPTPPDLTGKMPNFLPGVVLDAVPLGKKFGDVVTDVKTSYSIAASPSVSAVFWGANPRVNFGQQPNFLTVDQQVNGQWVTVATDADWETKFSWQRVQIASSYVTVQWNVPQDAAPGNYRLRVTGQYKGLFGKISPYSGVSSTFTLTA